MRAVMRVKRDHEGVEVGAHVGLLVDGAGTRRPSTPPFSVPATATSAESTANYRSTI